MEIKADVKDAVKVAAFDAMCKAFDADVLDTVKEKCIFSVLYQAKRIIKEMEREE